MIAKAKRMEEIVLYVSAWVALLVLVAVLADQSHPNQVIG
jgi:hypothetical protein